MEKVPILIVEDDAIIAADLANKVRRMGFQVLGPTYTAEEAVDMAKRRCPHVALMDIYLDGKMRIETAKVIQELCDNLPVIFVSGDPDDCALDRVNLTGPYTCISKPFDKRELTSQIEKVLKK